MKLFELHPWDHTSVGDSEKLDTTVAFTVVVGVFVFVVLAIVSVLMAAGLESA